MWKWWMFTACRSVSVFSDPKPTPSLQLHSSKCMHAKDIYIFIQKWSSLEMRYEKLFWIWQELEINNFAKEEECSQVKSYFMGRDETYVLLNWIQNPPLPFCPHPYHQLLLPTESKHRTWPAWPSSLRIPSLFSGDWLLDFLTIDHYSPDKVLYPRPILFSSHLISNIYNRTKYCHCDCTSMSNVIISWFLVYFYEKILWYIQQWFVSIC